MLISGPMQQEMAGKMRAALLGLGFAVAPALALAAGFTVTSPDFPAGGTIPLTSVFNRFGCQGQNRSPELTWVGEPAGTQSFAVTMYDPDAPGGGFTHWTVFNIPASVHQLPAGAGADGSRLLPVGAEEGRNDFGFSYYGGPCPPPGSPHHYVITVYALKVARLPLAAAASGALVAAALPSETLAKAQITSLYGR